MAFDRYIFDISSRQGMSSTDSIAVPSRSCSLLSTHCVLQSHLEESSTNTGGSLVR